MRFFIKAQITAALLVVFYCSLSFAGEEFAPTDTLIVFPLTGFSFEYELNLPGTPETIFDAVTGDISGWWDHSFSEEPLKFYIEPKPGGGFYEIINENGDGFRHAEVIACERGKLLRFQGPLGLSGRAVTMVHSYEFVPVGNDSTKMKLSVHAMGEFSEGLPKIIKGVWKHFLIERLKPYIEAGKNLNR